jgi:hypothetical protein
MRFSTNWLRARRSAAFAGFVLAQALGTAVAAHGDHACAAQEVASLDEPISGRAALCVTSRGLRAQMHTRDLVPGDAYTVWWVYFDDPSACATPGQCGPPDFGGADPLAVFGRMDSAIPGERGRVRFHGQLRGMQPSGGSQVWLLIFGHGAADLEDGRQLARQLLTPEDAAAGAPHLGIVGGPQGHPAAVAVFQLD